MIQKTRICELCKRPNILNTLFCPRCMKDLQELKNKKIGDIRDDKK